MDQDPGNEAIGLKRVEATLPADWYHDPVQHERELEAIWYRAWLYVCRSAEIGPGQYRTHNLGTQTVLLVRDVDGTLRAFHNTCRHRGAELCPAGAGPLKSRAIVCRYHQWTYGLDGALARTPHGTTAPDFDPSAYGLHKVGVREWRGFVYVNIVGDGVDFDAALDPSPAWLANWPLERLVVGHAMVRELACNWKVFWENYNECLHCPSVHPSLCDLVPIYGRAIMRPDDPAVGTDPASDDPRHRGGLRRGAETWSMNGLAAKPGFDTLTPQERAKGYRFLTIVPSGYVVAHPDYVRVVSMRPLGAERTELKAEWLFLPETLADPSFDLANIVDFATTVMAEDAEVCEINQRGLRARAYREGVLMPQEYELKAFHDWVRRRLGAADRHPTGS